MVIFSSSSNFGGGMLNASTSFSVSMGGFAASGLRDATARLDVAAHNIANANTDGFIPERISSAAMASGGVTPLVDTGYSPLGEVEAATYFGQKTDSQTDLAQTDLVTEFSGLILAKAAFQANAKVLSVYDRTLGLLVNREA